MPQVKEGLSTGEVPRTVSKLGRMGRNKAKVGLGDVIHE
jgi:hypothetical protein